MMILIPDNKVSTLKWIALLEGLLIILLLGILVYTGTKNPATAISNVPKNGLLSPRVYAGLLPSKSFLILNFAPLREALNNYTLKNNYNVSVYVVNLRDGASFGVNAGKGYPPASLNKIPLAILIMRKIENSDLTLGSRLTIHDEDRTNSFGNLYKTGEKISTEVLLQRMLRDSDDTAFHVLRHEIDRRELDLLLDYSDYFSKESISAQEYITPRSVYALFSSLYLSTILEPEHSEYILTQLTNTVFDIQSAAQLPKNVTIAQKFGYEYLQGEPYFHDCGIMYISDMRIFYCIMTKDLDRNKAAGIVGTIVHEIYQYVLETRKKLDTYRVNG